MKDQLSGRVKKEVRDLFHDTSDNGRSVEEMSRRGIIEESYGAGEKRS